MLDPVSNQRSLAAALSVGLIAATGLAAGVHFYIGEMWLRLAASLSAALAACMFLWRFRGLPPRIFTLVCGAALVLIVGLGLSLFRKFELFELFAHLGISVAAAYAAAAMLRVLVQPRSVHPRILAVLPVVAILSVSLLWEASLGPKGRWGDTSLDMMLNALGAVGGAVLYRRQVPRLPRT